MREKTYLSPEEQWDQTVEMVCRLQCPAYKCYWAGDPYYDRVFWEDAFLNTWYVGQVIQTHRLFCVGDLVIINISNGGGQKQTVWAVTSKRYTVKGFYLAYKRSCRGKLLDAGPLRIVEGAEHLIGLRPDAPALRQFCVGLAREACRKPGKRE